MSSLAGLSETKDDEMTRKPKPEATAAKPVAQVSSSFPIVGIGASAGGLEALELFLRHLPEKSGLGFVVVQHLDPTHKGMLVEPGTYLSV